MKSKKIGRSLLSGLAILLVSWVFQNYDFSFSAEDGFFKKISVWKYKIFSPRPTKKAEFVFINTGKDLTLVEDTADYGNITVSDREKIYRLMKQINQNPDGPAFTVLDLQFYYPFSTDLRIDTLLREEISKNQSVVIPVLKKSGGDYKMPLYETAYAYSDYTTYGSGFNKFRILRNGDYPSIPVLLHEKLENKEYKGPPFFATCNGRLSLAAIWPTYYLRNETVRNNELDDFVQFYNLGELLMDIEANPANHASYFKNRIVMVGNFEDDVHTTTLGKMSGPILLANIYLSLLNDQHIVNIWMILILLAVFSGLSYIAWYGKMPELRINFNFIMSSWLNKFVKGYISYFGFMFFLSIFCMLVFNVQVALFLPSFIFAGIEYIRYKKYRPDKISS